MPLNKEKKQSFLMGGDYKFTKIFELRLIYLKINFSDSLNISFFFSRGYFFIDFIK